MKGTSGNRRRAIPFVFLRHFAAIFRSRFPILPQKSSQNGIKNPSGLSCLGFQRCPYLQASIISEGSGTVITGRFMILPVVRLFGIVWLAGLGLLGVAMIVSLLLGQDTDINGVLTPLGLLAFGFLLTYICRLLARGEERFLADYLIETLNATERRPVAVAQKNITE